MDPLHSALTSSTRWGQFRTLTHVSEKYSLRNTPCVYCNHVYHINNSKVLPYSHIQWVDMKLLMYIHRNISNAMKERF